jgi:hypothetical protein
MLLASLWPWSCPRIAGCHCAVPAKDCPRSLLRKDSSFAVFCAQGWCKRQRIAQRSSILRGLLQVHDHASQ